MGFLEDDRGGASLEFVVVALALFLLIAGIVDTGLLMARAALVERALQVAVREARVAGALEADFAGRVCHIARVVGGCERDLRIELVRLDQAGAPCDPGRRLAAGLDEPLPGGPLLVRACLSVSPLFPPSAAIADVARDGRGGLAVTAEAAFVPEPPRRGPA
ncbi:MAG: TadE/TadG family type IV pilus assembly protein [Pseudomonadota bacterium]